MKSHERHLTRRDRQILEFVLRYRIGTSELIWRRCFQSQTSDENVNRVLLRLRRRGLLRRVTAARGYHYYTITRQSLRLLEQEPRSPRPLTEQTLPVVLAVATYCVERNLQRLTSAEFRENYPELWRPGMRSSNYVLVDIDEKLHLEILLVDRGGAVHRTNSRIRRVISQRKNLPAFNALMKANRFRITILTGTQQQRDKITRRLDRKPFGPIQVTACIIPQLADLLILRK